MEWFGREPDPPQVLAHPKLKIRGATGRTVAAKRPKKITRKRRKDSTLGLFNEGSADPT
jgi:hypothetical protein